MEEIYYTYDPENRQVGSYGSFASAWGYNSADGLAWRQYPGGNNGQLGELVSFGYDQRLQLTTTTGDYDYVSASAYDAAGRLMQRSLGNVAVLSQYSYYPWEQQGGRLQQLLSGTPADSDSLQDLRYSYDLSGNLLSLQDYLAGAPQTQSFGYDALDRLVSASASGGDNGLGDYSQEMAYDHGSVSLASSGHLRQKGELLYLYGDSGHTHAVTAVSDGWRYDYDPNGNLLRKVSQPWSLLELYLPVVMSSLPEEALDAPPEPPESQPAPVSPYPPPEEQSRAEPSGLVAWLHSAWDFLVNWFDGGTQTAQAAGLLQAYPPPGDPTPTPDPNPPEAPEEIEYTYDPENRLVSVSAGDMQASFVYDGDGQRVASVIAGATTVYIGEVFEWEVTTGSMRRYYYAGTQNSPSPQRSGGERVGVRVGSAAPVWLLGDHLGSTSVAANTDGSLLSRQGYLPWGELRFAEGSLPGRYQFTGQASYEAEFGLYYFKARWYDPHLGRFSQPDSLVPDPGNPLDWDRYAYVRNNPEKYVDPNGHNPLLFLLALVGGVVIGGAIGGGYLAYDIFVNTPPIRSINGTDVARPTSTNMTEWTLKQIKDGLNSPMLDAIKSNWGALNPISKGAAVKLWVGMVRSTGYWDYKPDILEALGKDPLPLISLGGYKTSYQAIANLNYGFLGAAAGFSATMLEVGAGFAQYEEHRKFENCNMEFFCDQPYDNWWVLFGMHLYELYGDNIEELTPETLEDALNNYIDNNGEPPGL